MADIVDKLRWLSSPGGEHMDNGPRLTEFCHAGNKAADEIERLRAALERIADTDPDEGTHWFHDVARTALGGGSHD